MPENGVRVLDVGSCTPDHATLHRMLTENFDVTVDQASQVGEALDRMRAGRYDLVLFNRVIFDDGGEGIELLKRAKQDRALASVPIMMISNFPDAQAAAAAAGGERGFGKRTVMESSTVELLSKYLPRRPSR